MNKNVLVFKHTHARSPPPAMLISTVDKTTAKIRSLLLLFLEPDDSPLTRILSLRTGVKTTATVRQ